VVKLEKKTKLGRDWVIGFNSVNFSLVRSSSEKMLVGRRLKTEQNFEVSKQDVHLHDVRNLYNQLIALHNISCRGKRKYPRGSITRLGRTSNCWGRLFRQRYSRRGEIPGPPFDPARCYKWSYKAIFWWKQTWSRRLWPSLQGNQGYQVNYFIH
jgi:hypothetical protein